MDFKQLLSDKFSSHFEGKPMYFRAPGRINLIGEHTDYNEGFVLPASIERAVYLAINKNGTDSCNIVALDMDDRGEIDLTKNLIPTDQQWLNYPLGVIAELKKSGYQVDGFDACFLSDIPIGSGLSSSAALESAFAFGIAQLMGHSIDREELARIGQMAEHHYAGVECGIMDQFASCLGKHKQAIRLDCRDLSYEYVPADFGNYELVLFDTQVKHDLASSAYNERRAQCEEGLKALQEVDDDIKSLRDATMDQLDAVSNELSDEVLDRCEYVINENLRVIEAVRAMRNQDMERLGALMFETHQGLRDLYEVSCNELDVLVRIARNHPNIIGARMMGGGFGGCTINLVEAKTVDKTIEEVLKEYAEEIYSEAKAYKVKISDGVSQL